MNHLHRSSSTNVCVQPKTEPLIGFQQNSNLLVNGSDGKCSIVPSSISLQQQLCTNRDHSLIGYSSGSQSKEDEKSVIGEEACLNLKLFTQSRINEGSGRQNCKEETVDSKSDVIKRCNRYRFSFELSLNHSCQLERISRVRPDLLQRFGIVSMKIGDSGEMKFRYCSKSPGPSPIQEQQNEKQNLRQQLMLSGLLKSESDSERICKRSSNDNRSPVCDSLPSTSENLFNEQSLNDDGRNLSQNVRSVDVCLPHQSSVNACSAQRRDSHEVVNHSPLLVNLLRSSSPSGSTSATAHHSATVPFNSHSSLVSSNSHHSAGYPYTYVGSVPLSLPHSTDVIPSTSVSTNDIHELSTENSQQGKDMNMDPQCPISSVQNGRNVQTLPANSPNYFSSLQYVQHRQPMLGASYMGREGVPHHSTVYQQGQAVTVHPTQRIQAQDMQQNQIRRQNHPGQAYYPTLAVGDGITSSEGSASPKKRRKPTKKQLKEAELAQQLTNSAQTQRHGQQQYINEPQQERAGVSPQVNAHTVERPNVRLAVHGPSSVNIPFNQGPVMLSSAVAQHSPIVTHSQLPVSSDGGMYYPQQASQQQHIWSSHPSHQQVFQRSQTNQNQQAVYSAQMQQRWQNLQIAPRLAYTQPDSGGSETSSPHSGLHASAIANRSTAVGYPSTTHSSGTSSPLYQQQAQRVIFPPHHINPSSAVLYDVSPDQGLMQQRVETLPHLIQSSSLSAMQQQQYNINQERSTQVSSAHMVIGTSSEFGMDDELGANIIDDCGDFNDLDSIEPMKESGDVGVALIATEQQEDSHMMVPEINQTRSFDPEVSTRYSMTMQHRDFHSNDNMKQDLHRTSSDYAGPSLRSPCSQTVRNYEGYPAGNVNVCYRSQQPRRLSTSLESGLAPNCVNASDARKDRIKSSIESVMMKALSNHDDRNSTVTNNRANRRVNTNNYPNSLTSSLSSHLCSFDVANERKFEAGNDLDSLSNDESQVVRADNRTNILQNPYNVANGHESHLIRQNGMVSSGTSEERQVYSHQQLPASAAPPSLSKTVARRNKRKANFTSKLSSKSNLDGKKTIFAPDISRDPYARQIS